MILQTSASSSRVPPFSLPLAPEFLDGSEESAQVTHLGHPNGLQLVPLQNGPHALGGDITILGEGGLVLGQVEAEEPGLEPAPLTHG